MANLTRSSGGWFEAQSHAGALKGRGDYGSRRGRKSDLSEELITQICIIIEQRWCPPSVAAQAMGVPISTFLGWMRKGEENQGDAIYRVLYDAVQTASARSVSRATKVIRTAALEAHPGDWRAAKYHLERELGPIEETPEQRVTGNGRITVNFVYESTPGAGDDSAPQTALGSGTNSVEPGSVQRDLLREEVGENDLRDQPVGDQSGDREPGRVAGADVQGVRGAVATRKRYAESDDRRQE